VIFGNKQKFSSIILSRSCLLRCPQSRQTVLQTEIIGRKGQVVNCK